MKKFIFLISLLLLASCGKIETDENGNQVLKEERIRSIGTEYVNYVMFNKHRYIRYRTGRGGSITHDPECPYCKSNW